MENDVLKAITECVLSYAEQDHTLESLSEMILLHVKHLTRSPLGLMYGAECDTQGNLHVCPFFSGLADDCVNVCIELAHHDVFDTSTAFGDCSQNNRIVIVNDISMKSLYSHPNFPSNHPKISCAALIPLTFKGRPSGLIGMANRQGGYALSELEALRPFFIVVSNILASFQLTDDVLAAKEAQVQMAKTVADAKDSFLAKISHEIRTPLNGIVGMTRVLLNMNLSQDTRLKVDIINECSYQLISQVDDLLDYTKMTCGKLALTMDAVCVRSCVEKAFDVISSKANEKQLTINTLVTNDVPVYITADGKRLRQILVNLLNNAVKFTSEGSIIVKVSMADTQLIQFQVEDTGSGIPPEEQNLIFDTFTQGSGGTQLAEGAGLGLAISSKLIELMGGSITVTSVPLEGSCFTFTIHATTAVMPDCDRRRYQVTLNGLRALIVDDKVLNQVVLCSMLQSWGIGSVMCDSGYKALEYLKNGLSFDIGFIDIQMPSMDGYELATRIKNSNYPYFPLVAASSVDTWTTVNHNLFAMQLQKPLKQELVYDTILRVLHPTKTTESPRKISFGRAPTPKVAHILVAEDSDTNQKVIESQLGQLGFTDITTVENGLQAVIAQKKGNYDIIFMDLKMPVMNGFDAAKRIRKQSPVGHKPYIVALTAMVLDSDKKRCFEAGMDYFIGKPVDMDELDKVLNFITNKIH